MELIIASNNILAQLRNLIEQVEEADFIKSSPTVNASIGQHARHILEFFQCLEKGVKSGELNYDQRNHDQTLETDKNLALAMIDHIGDFINKHTSDYNLILEGNYRLEGESQFQIRSNYHRELAYNVEHAIHHMALIKIGVKENAPYVRLPDDFGIASSTIRYRKQQPTV